jgi:dihydroorotase
VLAGRAFYGGRIQPLELAIDPEGFIVRVGRDLHGPRRHDVGDRLILPAATDLHVHFRDPTDVALGESWGTGTVQAALGGVGLVGEMPNASPPVDRLERLLERRDAGRGRLAVDMLLYAQLTSPRRVAALSEECGGFKLYLAPTTGIDPSDEAEEPLGPRLDAVAASGLPLSVHAEDPRAFREGAPPSNSADWSNRRPEDAERAAVESVRAAAPPGLRLNFAHVTVPDVADLLRVERLAFEVTPHHLLLAARSDDDSGRKVNPPLRPEPVRRALFERFARGEVPFLASDHAPHPLEAKQRPFALAPSGMPGVATLLPLLLAQVRSGTVPLPVLVAAACDRPARWLGVPMGRLAPGHRAHLIVVDPRVRTVVDVARLGTRCGWSAFAGQEAVFPLEHFRDGELIVQAGEYVGRPTGRFVRPEYAPLRRERGLFPSVRPE